MARTGLWRERNDTQGPSSVSEAMHECQRARGECRAAVTGWGSVDGLARRATGPIQEICGLLGMGSHTDGSLQVGCLGEHFWGVSNVVPRSVWTKSVLARFASS